MSFYFHDWIKCTYTRTEVLLSHNLPEYTRLCYLPLWESRKLKWKFIQTKGESNPTVLLQVMLPKREEKFSENTTIIRRLILILTKMIQWNILIGVTLLYSVLGLFNCTERSLILLSLLFCVCPLVSVQSLIWFCWVYHSWVSSLAGPGCSNGPQLQSRGSVWRNGRVSGDSRRHGHCTDSIRAQIIGN